MLKLSTKCCISAFNAQGSRGIRVAVECRSSENLCSNSGGAQRKKERQGETGDTITISWFQPPLNAHVLFLQVFFEISPRVWPNSGYWCCLFPDLTDISNKLWTSTFSPGSQIPTVHSAYEMRSFCCLIIDHACLLRILGWNKQNFLRTLLSKRKTGQP
jgi:hypothetical protein